MKITLNWLRELVDTDLPAAAVAERLTAAGLEVEGIGERGRDLDGVIVGEIARVDPHPQAERLVVCEVRTGPSSARSVVCGARNMKAGDRVALATVGARVPDGREIAAAEIRGVRSEGMLCSAVELGLGDDASGIMILSATAEVGAHLADALEITDTVLELAPTPNRGDWLSVLGVAREISALAGAKLSRRRPALREKGAPSAEQIAVRIADPELCGRYAARVVADVRVGPSPAWMQHRLQAVGLRPVNNVVDVTNYVMIERGQPLHAFDLDRLPQAQIVVRRAEHSCEFITLDETTRRLDADDLLITTGAVPVAVAGVMGGADSAVTPQTTRVLLESAWFQPTSIRRTARRLGLQSESSYRFERGVDIEGVISALDRAAALLVRVAGASVAPGVVDVYPRPFVPAPVQLRVQRVHDLLGVAVDRARVVGSLKALGATVTAGPRGALSVEPPSYRSDLTREVDLIEEIARVIGYDEISATLPVSTLAAGDEGERRSALRGIRALLAAQGWCEAVTLSFTSAEANQTFSGVIPAAARAVEIRNPLSADHTEMRFSLLPGLIGAVRHNLNQGERSVALYNAGKVFWQEAGGRYCEGERLGGALIGSVPREGLGRGGEGAGFHDVKGAVESVLDHLRVETAWDCGGTPPFLHPGLSARLHRDGTAIGVAGALHPTLAAEIGSTDSCWLFELDLDILLQYPRTRFFQEVPRFPSVVRDLAIVTDEDFVAGEVVRFVRSWGHEWIEGVRLFDQYRGAPIPAGHKSLAYTITYRAAERTLTDDEVNALHDRLTSALRSQFGVELRR